MKKVGVVMTILLWLMATMVYARDLTSTHFIVRDPELGTGGGYQSSASYTMYSAGNTNVSGNLGTSASYIGRAGFLQYPQVTASVLSGVLTGSQVALTWTPSTAYDGYNVSGYKIGIGTASGGPYTLTPLSNSTTNYTYSSLTPGVYYFVVQTLDAYGSVIATSNEVTETIQESISFSISNNAISFGPLTTSGPRYATTSGGSSSLTPAHTIAASSNSTNGYSLYYNGSTLASGANTIAPATIAGSTIGTAGANQFALSLLASGSASVPTSYDQSSQNWNFTQNTLSTIASTAGPTTLATLNAYYLANAAVLAPAGTYSTTLTYEMTANY
jgi:hypothetical protein